MKAKEECFVSHSYRFTDKISQCHVIMLSLEGTRSVVPNLWAAGTQ